MYAKWNLAHAIRNGINAPSRRSGLLAQFRTQYLNLPQKHLRSLFRSPRFLVAAKSFNQGRLPFMNLSYAFICLITSQNTHIPNLPQVA